MSPLLGDVTSTTGGASGAGPGSGRRAGLGARVRPRLRSWLRARLRTGLRTGTGLRLRRWSTTGQQRRTGTTGAEPEVLRRAVDEPGIRDEVLSGREGGIHLHAALTPVRVRARRPHAVEPGHV